MPTKHFQKQVSEFYGVPVQQNGETKVFISRFMFDNEIQTESEKVGSK